MPSLSPEEEAKIKRGNKLTLLFILGAFGLIVIVALGAILIGSLTSSGKVRDAAAMPTGASTVKPGKVTVQKAPDVAPVVKEWHPKGYNLYEPGLAFKWVTPECDYGDWCWAMIVRSEFGCPDGVYAEMNIEKNGVITDYSNATVGSLPAATPARMEFHYFGSRGGLEGSLTELTCHGG